MATELEAAPLAVYNAARLEDPGQPFLQEPEGVARAVQAALDRAHGDADLLGDLLVGAVLHLAHHERDAVALVHPLDGRVDGLAQLAAVGLALRVVPRGRELHRPAGRAV